MKETMDFIGQWQGGALACGTAFLLLSGCLAGPDYKKPAAADVPEKYGDLGTEWKVAEPKANLSRGNWWEIFGDEELNQLEEKAGSSNQALKAEEQRFNQARELFNVSRAGLFPHIGVSGSVTRERQSANRPINGVSNGRPDTFTTYSVPLDLNYELDLWGKVRREMEAGKASEEAAVDLLQSLRLSIQAEIASDWFTLHSLDEQITLLSTNISVFSKSLELNRNRRRGGIATDLDVSQAETILRSTEGQLRVIELQRIKLEHAIAVLVGEYPSTFKVPSRRVSKPPLTLPPGLPSELMERRPDISSAERRMAAANAGIGVAKAAFFPRLSIRGAAGFESVSAGSLFSWPSRLWAVGPSIKVPLFEGGRLRARYRQAKYAYEETVADYRQTVLVAFSEVEDNLAAQQLLAQEFESKNAALVSSRKTLEIATNRYRSGLVTYLEVATAQNEELAREQETVRLNAERQIASVALIKALGGGWEKNLRTDR